MPPLPERRERGLRLFGEVEPGVRLWRASLDVGGVADEVQALLSDDERARAATFGADRDRRRFVAARGLLRELLGEVLGADPASLRFGVEPGTTKPRLAWPPVSVSFNLSHSTDQVLYAVSTTDAVDGIGVDIERVRQDVDVDAMAARFFSGSEHEALARIADPPARVAAYFACWTGKEALVKGLGLGVRLKLSSFDVQVSSPGPAPVTGRGSSASLVDGWVVHPLDLGPQMAGAVALHRSR